MDENSISSETTGESCMSLTSVSMDGNNTCIHNRKNCKQCNFHYKPHKNKIVRQKSNALHILSNTISDDSSLVDTVQSETDKLKRSKKNMARENTIESTDDVEKFNKKNKANGRSKESIKKEKVSVLTSQSKLTQSETNKSTKNSSEKSSQSESKKSSQSESGKSSKSESKKSSKSESKKSSKSESGKSASGKSSQSESGKSASGKSSKSESGKSASGKSINTVQQVDEKQKIEEEKKLIQENKEEEKVIKKQAIKDTNPLEKTKTPLSGRLISANEDPNIQVDRVGKLNEKPSLKNFKVIGIPENTYLAALRRNNLVFIEGFVGKRMYFCSCFFHERYFILTKEGVLIYLRNFNILEKESDKTGENEMSPNEDEPKCTVDEVKHENLWLFSRPRCLNLKEAIDLQRIFKDENSYPYRILIRHIDYDDELAFKEEGIRDMWVERISWVMNKTK